MSVESIVNQGSKFTFKIKVEKRKFDATLEELNNLICLEDIKINSPLVNEEFSGSNKFSHPFEIKSSTVNKDVALSHKLDYKNQFSTLKE